MIRTMTGLAALSLCAGLTAAPVASAQASCGNGYRTSAGILFDSGTCSGASDTVNDSEDTLGSFNNKTSSAEASPEFLVEGFTGTNQSGNEWSVEGTTTNGSWVNLSSDGSVNNKTESTYVDRY